MHLYFTLINCLIELLTILIGMVTFGRVGDFFGGHIASLLTAIFQIVGVTMMSFYTNKSSIELNLLGEWDEILSF